MAYWWKPPVTVVGQQVWDGSTWVNQLGTSEGKIYVQPYIYSAGPVTLTSTGPSAEVDSEVGVIVITWYQINDASSTAPDVRLQGSVDGTNWFDLDQSTEIGQEMRHVVYKAVRYFRIYVQDLGDATQITCGVWGMR